MDEKRIHFVLVHGGCHGAWCWFKLATLLSSAGHTVSALDLAASGINPKQLGDIPTISGHLEPLMTFMAALPSHEKVVLVGHSYGGISISVAMEKFPHKVSVAVYVTAIMPHHNFNLLQLNQQYFTRLDNYMDSKFTFNEGVPTSILLGPKLLSSIFYPLSPLEDLSLALLLERPYPLYWDATSIKEAILTEKNYGSVNRAYIVSGEDLIIPEEAQRSMNQNYPPDEVKVISGSDHMVMLSKPQELCYYLQEIAEKYY